MLRQPAMSRRSSATGCHPPQFTCVAAGGVLDVRTSKAGNVGDPGPEAAGLDGLAIAVAGSTAYQAPKPGHRERGGLAAPPDAVEPSSSLTSCLLGQKQQREVKRFGR